MFAALSGNHAIQLWQALTCQEPRACACSLAAAAAAAAAAAGPHQPQARGEG
jgi:hypothetical protein